MRLSLSRALRSVHKKFFSRRRRQCTRLSAARLANNRHFFEALEDRRLLATLYVDNPGDFVITNDADMSGPGTPTLGDTVTWNPGAGTQHPTAPVTGLIYGTSAFGTIQSAVTAATAGDTIRVGPGTFAESVNVSKQLFVFGNQVGADAQNGRPGASETIVDAGGATDFAITASDVELNGFTIQGADVSATPYGITMAVGTHGTHIIDNIIQNNQAGLSLANNSSTDQTVVSGNLFLTNNANAGGAISGTAIYSDQFTQGGTMTNVLIDNNTFTTNNNGGIIIGPTDATMGASNITISRNIMTGSGNAILLFNTTNSTIANNEISGSTASQVVIGGGDSGLSIHNNFISNGATNGIRIGDFGGGSANSNVTINRNSISGNATAGLNISTGGYTGPLDATLNWWGSSTGPTIATNTGGTGDAIIDPDSVVDYTPFLTSGTDAQPTVRGFQVVIADVGVTKTATPNPAVPGTALTYTIVVNNAGPDTVDATVTDIFPAGFTGAVFTSTGVNATGNSASGSGTINDSVTIQSGGSITYTVTGTVAPTATGTLTNTAMVTPQTGTQLDNTANNSSTTNTPLTPQADLAISKSDGATTAATGSTHTYTIVVSNSGPSAVTGATVVDTFNPASFSSTSFTVTQTGGANGATASSGTGVQNINQTVNLPVGATITYVVTATVSPTASGAVTNTATVTAPAGTTDANLTNNTATDTDTVAVTTTTTDLSIAKTDGATTAAPGGPLTYTIVVANNGPSPVVGATVADLFPPTFTGPTFTVASTGGASGATNGSGNLLQTVNLPVGATITYTVTGTVSPTAIGAITNTAIVSAPAGVADANAANNVATDTDTIAAPTALADLSISKSDGVTTVAAGGATTYTIVVSNVGTTPVTAATLTDILPANTTLGTFTPPSGWTVNTATPGLVTAMNTTPLAVGATATFTLTVNVSGTAAGAITNTASVATPPTVVDVSPANNVATDTDTVALTPATTDLTIMKTDGVTTAPAGSTLNYTITVTNAGQSTVTGATVADVFSPQFSSVTFTAAGSTGSSGFSNSTGTGVNNINQALTLPAGGSVTYTVSATLSPTATGAVSNIATVTAPAGVVDSNAANNVAVDADTITPIAPPQTDLSITKTDAVTSVSATAPNNTVTYVIVVSNNGTTTVTGASVTDIFPATLTGVSYTSTGSAGTSGNTATGTGNIIDTVTLPAGGTITYTVNATVSPNATGTLSNTATVTPPTTVVDVNPTNNTATDIDTVTANGQPTPINADLGIFKTDGVVTVAPGSNVTYTIVVSNSGPDSVAGATVADTFPATLTNVSFTASGTGGATGFSNSSGNINQTVNLPAGATIIYTVNATVSPTAAAGTTIANTATVAAPAGVTDANQANNSSTDTDTVGTTTATTDLSVFKTDGVATVTAGQMNLTYTIRVTNLGATPVTGATLTDVLPPNTAFESFMGPLGWVLAVPSPGIATATNTTALAPGATAIFTLVVDVNANATGAVTNTAVIAAPTGTVDTNAANNVSTDTDVISPVVSANNVDLSITKTDNSATASPGSTVTYIITVANAGPTTATGATVSDIFPQNFTGVSYTATGTTGTTGFTTTGSGNINDTVTIPTGGSITYTVTGTVPSNAIGALANTATVTASANNHETNPADNAATDVDLFTTIDLGVTKVDTPDPVPAGQNITYTITLTNSGTGVAAANSITLTDPVPLNTTFVSCTAPTGWTCTNNAGTVTATNTTGTLSAGGTATFTLIVNANSTTPNNTTITNTATVTATRDTNSQNNTATATTTVTAPATTVDVGVTKVDTPDPVPAGQNLTYTIALTNSGTGAAAANSVTLTDAVPLNTTFVSCTAPTGFTCTNNAGTVTGTNTTGALAAGGTATFTLVVNVNAATPNNTTITNTATVAATGDNNGANDTATATTTVTAATPPQVDLSITKDDGATSVDIGGTLTYTIVVHNAGPSAANGAVVNDVFPANLTNVNFTASGTGGANSFDTSGSGNINDMVNLPAGATITYIVTATVSPSATPGGTVANTATVTAPAGVTDTNPANNSSTDTDTITPPNVENTPDVAVTKTEDQSTVAAGDNLTYTIIVSNLSQFPAQNVTLTDALPADTTFVSFTAPAGWTTSTPAAGGTGTIVATIPTLAAGATATFTLVVNVNGTAVGGEELSNTAVVTSSTAETTLNNNSSTVTATVEEVVVGLPECDIFTENQPNQQPGTAEIVVDADNPGTNALVITGTNRNDVIVVEKQPKSQSGMFRVVQNKHVIVTFIPNSVSRIVIFGLGGNDSITVSPLLKQQAIIFGGTGNDVIVAGSGDTQVSGGDGNDKIVGGRGNDTLCGDNGNDVIVGGLGNDTIFGEAGNDVINGGVGDDLLLGGDGNDVIDGAVGNDHIYGQAGNDTIVGGFGNNILVGGDGKDKIVARYGRNIIIGGNGSDQLYGNAADDILIGGSTAHDENDAALQSILDEWSSSDSYTNRVNFIRNGGGANGAFVLDDTTVFDDGVADQLIGSAGRDWFWVGVKDRIKDRAKNEQVN